MPVETRSRTSGDPRFKPYLPRIYASSGRIDFDWEDILDPHPDANDYSMLTSTINAGRYVNYGTALSLQLKPVRMVYKGVDHRGRNQGVAGIIDRTSYRRGKKKDFIGSQASGEFEYFKAEYRRSCPQLHRGHLLARSLNGIGDRLNWVPLKSNANLAEWHLLEKKVFDHINAYSLNKAWVEIDISLEYAYDIPIPSAINYVFQRYRRGSDGRCVRVGVQVRRSVRNDLAHDTLSYTTRNKWA